MARPANFAKAVLSAGLDASPALVYRDTSITYGQLREGVRRFAAQLVHTDLEPGDRVVLLSDTTPFSLSAYLAIMWVGGVAVPLSPATRQDHLKHQIQITGARHGFLQWKYRLLWQEPSIEELLPLVWMDNIKKPGAVPERWHPAGLLGEQLSGDREAEPADVDRDSLASIVFTSGSTGTPRGVMVSHENLAANTESIISYLGLTAADRTLLVLPLYYCYGASVIQTHLWVGGSVAFSRGFMFPEKVPAEIRASRATGFYGVPSTFQILLRRTSFTQQRFPDLRYFAQAGGRLPAVFLDELRSAFPEIELYVMYGQTEGTARLSYLPPERLVDKKGSIGRGIPGTTLSVLDPDGRPVAPGEIGEVVAEGDNITLGYWRDAEETARYFKNGRLWTGDLATVDEDGFIYISDRRRDFIKVMGMRVSSKEVEDVLAELGEVVEVAVIGLPDETLGEAVTAFIVKAPGSSLEEEGVRAHARASLANEKVPQQVCFVDGLPKSEAGKIIKAALKKQALARRQGANHG